VCGRKLTDQASIAAGIGPKCKAAEEADKTRLLALMKELGVSERCIMAANKAVSKIKLLHLYRFKGITDSDNSDYSGLWETIECRNLQGDSPIWRLRRVASFTPGTSVGDTIDLPQFIVERYANRINRATLNGEPSMENADEQTFLQRMHDWNSEGDEKSYPCVTMGDINRLLGIIMYFLRF
jgi:hypothetical protein